MIYKEFLEVNETHSKAAYSVLGSFIEDAIVNLVKFKKGDVLLRYDDEFSDIWLLLSGRVVTITNQSGFGSFVSHEFSSPELFCEYEQLMGAKKVIADVEAKSDCVFLRISVDDYMKWVTQNTEIMLARTRRILNVLLAQGAVLQDTIFLSATERIVSFFIRYYEDEEGENVLVALNRNEIAEHIGVSSRSANRSIKKLVDLAILKIKKGKVVISDLEYNKLINYLDEKGS